MPIEKQKTQPANTSAASHEDSVQKVTKAAAVLALLKRHEGASLAELIDATGWQACTTRSALTGLRKKGHAIERRKRDDVTCYYIAMEA